MYFELNSYLLAYIRLEMHIIASRFCLICVGWLSIVFIIYGYVYFSVTRGARSLSTHDEISGANAPKCDCS
jgi:hypothetical protein